jgi:hypothetical protein
MRAMTVPFVSDAEGSHPQSHCRITLRSSSRVEQLNQKSRHPSDSRILLYQLPSFARARTAFDSFDQRVAKEKTGGEGEISSNQDACAVLLPPRCSGRAGEGLGRYGADPAKKKCLQKQAFWFGGERGIRTPGGHESSTVFKTAALNRSAISPI